MSDPQMPKDPQSPSDLEAADAGGVERMEIETPPESAVGANVEIDGEAGGEMPAEPEPTADEVITQLLTQIADLKDQGLRAQAEAENVRRRAAKEKADAAKFSITNFARDILSVPDNLSRAIDSVGAEARSGAGEAIGNLIEGVELTQRELLQVLERHGVTSISPIGEKFDPNFHQAMFEAPGTGEPDGTVVQVVQTGYLIGERLLRPAMVGVAKGGGSGDDDEAPGSQIDTSA